jgi:rhomboid protease GluP
VEKTDDAGVRSFVAYLAKVLIAKRGYRPGTVPEAQELFNHCETVLTRANGLTLTIVAIADPLHPFDLTKEALERIGIECLRYTGRVARRKLPVKIIIIEAGTVPVRREGLEHLTPLKSSPYSKVSLQAFALDLSTHKIWTNSPVRSRPMRFFLQRLMKRPRLSDAELAPKPHAALPERRPLILTYSLLAVLLAVFALEYFFRIGAESGSLDPSIETLVALGALDKTLVTESGEWWRLFSAPLLHAGLFHMAVNGIALVIAGAILENVIGRAWFAAIFAVSGICGALLSLAVNPSALVSVGASGAFMGLFAAAFAISYRYPAASRIRIFLQLRSLCILIPSMLPLFDGLFGQKVDYAAHLGGAIGGAAVGLVLFRIWAREAPLPPYRRLAWGFAAAALCGALYGGVQIAKGYEQAGLETHLVPAERMPGNLAAWKANSELLVESYPRDPRSHKYRALALIDKRDIPGAEREWRAALNEDKILHLLFKPEIEDEIRANLAATLKANGKEGEAHDVARPVCAKRGEIAAFLARAGLCP